MVVSDDDVYEGYGAHNAGGWCDGNGCYSNFHDDEPFKNLGFLDGHVKFIMPVAKYGVNAGYNDDPPWWGSEAYEYSYRFIYH